MNTVRVRNLEIGTGIPKICVPIVGISREEILSAGKMICGQGADLIEWRADWYEHLLDFSQTRETARLLRETIRDIPLLFTLRSAKEGGNSDLDPKSYQALNQCVIDSGYVDMIDLEVFTGDDLVQQLIKAAHNHKVKVIGSNHDFHGTPPKEEIISRLRTMQELGVDISKIAVMPQSKKDVLVLLEATEEMSRLYADRPIVTMSMSDIGMISRICGELSGSALTFGALGKTSAPGQIALSDLHTMLRLLHIQGV